jgi:hypothetical protein
MPTNGTPPPTWVIEPTTLYVVAFYETNATDEAPASIELRMRTYEEAVSKAKELIVANANEGVCCIYPANVSIVYPPIPWEDF